MFQEDSTEDSLNGKIVVEDIVMLQEDPAGDSESDKIVVDDINGI